MFDTEQYEKEQEAKRLQSTDSEQWGENEFGGAPLGDKRLSSRLVEIGRKQKLITAS